MADLITRLREAEESIPVDPIEQELMGLCGEAADRIERLRAVVDAAKEMADVYEAYEPRGDKWLDYPLHDVEILGAFKRRLAALEDKE